MINISISNYMFKVYSLIHYILIKHLLPCFSTSSFIYYLLWGPSTVSPQFSSSLVLLSVYSLSHVWLFAIHGLQNAGLPYPSQLLELSQTHIHRVGDAIQPSHPLSSPSPSAFSLSQQGLFQWVSSSIRWPKYWSFSFSISPSNEFSGLFSFRID